MNFFDGIFVGVEKSTYLCGVQGTASKHITFLTNTLLGQSIVSRIFSDAVPTEMRDSSFCMQRLDWHIFEALHKTSDGRKAIALFMVLKSIYRAGGIKGYSANKLRKKLGIHLNTLKRLMGILEDAGLVELVGGNKSTLRLRSIRTNWKSKDIDISFIKFELKRRANGTYEGVRYIINEIADELIAVFIFETNNRRDFAKRTVFTSANPRSLDEYKRATKEMRSRGYGKKFVHKGISYKGIGERLGISEAKAFCAVKHSLDKGILVKQCNRERIDTLDKENIEHTAKQIRDKFGKNCQPTFVIGRFVYFVGANDYLRGANAVHVRHSHRKPINTNN